MNNSVSCSFCNQTFTARRNYLRHVKKFHPSENVSPLRPANCVCPICEQKCTTVVHMQNHITQEHATSQLKFEELTFCTNEDFEKWKSEIEKNTCSMFVKRRGKKNSSNTEKNYFYCHRSGNYRSGISNEQTERQKNMKHSGSIKIGKTCPAMISVTEIREANSFEMKVQYQSVHLGHDQDIGKLALAESDRNHLASQMSIGISKSKILKDIAEKFSPKNRISYITNKDLNNIKRDYNISEEAILHADDATSVQMHVHQLQEKEPGCILIYKPVGDVSCPNISGDFLLGYMNKVQKHMLETYGNKVIMMDSTHGTNQYGFQLSTLLVNTSNNEGFPVAFLYSSKTTKEFFTPFFEEIKKRVPNLSPTYFMYLYTL